MVKWAKKYEKAEKERLKKEYEEVKKILDRFEIGDIYAKEKKEAN